MLNAGNPIGVMDSGIGGLTVVRELQRILPGEDIIYFGDSANCPYGNKTSDQIFELSSHMLQFLGDNGVKCTAIACNTISTMADRLRPCFDYKIVSIVEEAAKYVLREHLKSASSRRSSLLPPASTPSSSMRVIPSARSSARALPCSRHSLTAATSTSTTLTPRSVRRSTTFSRAKRSKT